MRPIRFYLPRLMCFLLCGCSSTSSSNIESELWRMDSFESIGNAAVSVEGNPQLRKSPYGIAIYFDGDGDRLIIDKNPLTGADEFTIEIMFNPADAYPENAEPRFFHIEAPDAPNRRVTIELRLNDKNQWYLDAHIKSDHSQLTLIDPAKVHPVGRWAHAAITYKNREFSSYVNRMRELTGAVEFMPIAPTAKTSVGARMNRIHWFKGEIAIVRITRRALKPGEFLSLTNEQVIPH